VLLNVKQYAADYGRNISVQYRVPDLFLSAGFFLFTNWYRWNTAECITSQLIT